MVTIKRLIIIISLLLFVVPFEVSAQDFQINIDFNQSTGFSTSKNVSKVFEEYDIAPGDVFTYNLKVNNSSPVSVNFYLNKIVRLAGFDLEMFTFQFYDGEKLLLEGRDSDFEKNLMSVLKANESKNYKLIVYFSPSAGNGYQSAYFEMQFVFGVEIYNDPSWVLPYTGESRLPYYILGGTTTITLIFVIILLIKRRKEEKESGKNT